MNFAAIFLIVSGLFTIIKRKWLEEHINANELNCIVMGLGEIFCGFLIFLKYLD